LPTPWIGVWERINVGVFLLWVIVLASALLRMPKHAAADAPRNVRPMRSAPPDARRRTALVVCYSRTGATRLVADAIAAKLGCEVEELVDSVSRLGWLGYLRGGFDAFFGRATELDPIGHDPAAYDLIVVGTPVWDRSLPPAARAYLASHGAALRQVAFFCTEDRFGAGRVFRQMTAACGRAPLAVLALHRDDITPRAVDACVAEFVDEIARLRTAA
jgi:flavodoxin